MFYQIIVAIEINVENFRDFVDDERIFTRSRKWDFKDFITFESFRNGTTNVMKLKDMFKISRINIINVLKGKISAKGEYLSNLKHGKP